MHPVQISLHHWLTIHGTGPYTSDDRRIACVPRYLRPDFPQQVSDKDDARQTRGEARLGNVIHVPPPQQAFHPEALACYEKISQAQAKVFMKGAKGK